jgi:CHAT domain-containing protein
VLADPDTPARPGQEGAAQEREWLPGALSLGRLPHARVEGAAIVRQMARGSRLLAGARAAEAALEARTLDDFPVVHFATHALVDEEHPNRSAILLAADGRGDDGLLQAREIADLPLDGKLVVLSACRSATGSVLAGEGVMGLSRAFFQAGARAVVGTLWTIRDDHAASFFQAFYASLARGQSVGTALQQARRLAIRVGMPSSAWSSVVVIGDDTVAPVARAAWPRGTPIAAALAGIGALAGGIAAMRRHRVVRRGSPADTGGTGKGAPVPRSPATGLSERR